MAIWDAQHECMPREELEQLQPALQALPRGGIHQGSDGFSAESQHIFKLDQGKPAYPHRWIVRQVIQPLFDGAFNESGESTELPQQGNRAFV